MDTYDLHDFLYLTYYFVLTLAGAVVVGWHIFSAIPGACMHACISHFGTALSPLSNAGSSFRVRGVLVLTS
jgi:hypothetical protein